MIPPTLTGSKGVAITWINRPYLRSPATMQWYHDKSLCPLHLKIVTQFAHPVSKVKSHTFCLNMPRLPQGCLGPALSYIGITVLLGCSVSSFSEKVLCRWLASCLCSPMEYSKLGTTTLIPHDGCLGRVLPFQKGEVIKTQDRVPPDWTHGWSHSASNGQSVGHLPKVKCLPPLIQQDNVTNLLTF